MTSDGPVEVPQLSKARLYREFAKRFGWGPDKVRQLTPAQQLVYLDSDIGEDTTTFKDHSEYLKWLTSR